MLEDKKVDTSVQKETAQNIQNENIEVFDEKPSIEPEYKKVKKIGRAHV